MSSVSILLDAAAKGDQRAAVELLPQVYEELRKLAASRMASEACGHSLNPTALVHEAYIRLVDTSDSSHWSNRGHFFAAAAEAMRRILVESARRKATLKRGEIDSDGTLTCLPSRMNPNAPSSCWQLTKL